MLRDQENIAQHPCFRADRGGRSHARPLQGGECATFSNSLTDVENNAFPNQFIHNFYDRAYRRTDVEML